MKPLCLFDLDGTLTDPQEGITKSVRHALSAFGIAVASLDELNHFIGPPLRDSFRAHYGFTAEEAELAVSKYREYFAETGLFENTLYPGILKMLARLQASGVLMAIATSKPTVYAEKIAAHFGFAQHFDFIAGSELDGTRSRKSEVITHALQTLGLAPHSSVVMIGDREHDIIGAQETGIDSIGVSWGYGPPEELAQARPTWIANTPDELCRLILERTSP